MSDKEASQQQVAPTEDFEDLYENAPCGYLSIEPNGRIFKANLTFAAWMGFPREDLVGKQWHDLLNMAGRIFFETHFAPLLRIQGFFNEVALDLLTQAGGRLPVLVNATEKRDAAGTHLFTRLTIFNATDRRRYERELLAARATAESAQRELQALNREAVAEVVRQQGSLAVERETSALREQFIAVLGHDLRNPLSSLGSGAALLLREPQTEKATRVLRMMQQSVGRMAGLIDNVMDFARGRMGGGFALTRTATTALGPALEQVISELRTSWPTRPIEAEFDLTETVSCDADRIAQLFSNLLGNALTHGIAETPIRARAVTDGGFFELSVSNGGEPIRPEAVAQLFQPFFRADVQPSQQGLGLGLFIVSEIARAHGGTIDVASTAEETRFTFRMPLQAS